MYFCQVFVSLNHVYQIGYNAKMKFLTLFALVTLMPSFVYAQTASLETLLKGIVGFTNNTLIPFLVGIAFLFFVINVFRYFIELIHDQLPLAVPCYDLVPVTEFTLGPL
jgi:uncharacterized membrane protein (GlpM family)